MLKVFFSVCFVVFTLLSSSTAWAQEDLVFGPINVHGKGHFKAKPVTKYKKFQLNSLEEANYFLIVEGDIKPEERYKCKYSHHGHHNSKHKNKKHKKAGKTCLEKSTRQKI